MTSTERTSTDLTGTEPAGTDRTGTEQTGTDRTVAAGIAAGSGEGSASAPAVAVRLFAGAAAAYGADGVTLRARTLREAIDALQVEASPAARRVISRSSLLLNAVACTDLDRHLADGDRLDVLPPFAGG